MLFKYCSDSQELIVGLLVYGTESGNRFRGSYPGNNIFSLGIHQIFTVEYVLTV